MKKRITALLICLCMCMGMINVLAASRESKEFSSEMGLIKGLGIMTSYYDGTDNPEDAVARGEYAQMIYRMLRFESTSDDDYYDDIDGTDYKNEINVLTNMGIFDGIGSRKFSPDERISGAAAIKTILLALGYKPYKDVYPEGYIETAEMTGLLDNIYYLGAESYITRAETAKLIYNALISHYEVIYENGYPKYEEREKSILEDKYDIAVVDGIVEENDCGGLYTDSNLDENKIRIDDIIVTAPQYRDLLGKRVKLYYNNESMTAVYADDRKNDVTVISNDDMSFSDGKFYKYEGSSRKEIRLDKHHVCTYNFEPVGFMAEKYIPYNGEVILIDNNQDGRYDVVKISDYKSYRIKSVSDDKVYFNKSNGDFVDFNNKYICADEDFNLESLAANDVMSYFEHNDVIKIKLSKETVTGKVNSVSEEDGKYYGTVNGTKRRMLNTDNYDWIGGAETVYYIDFMGNIADADEGLSKMIGGYLINCYCGEGDDKVYARIYVSGDAPKHYPIADRYSLDGKSVKTIGLNPETAPTAKLPAKNQLIRFRTNENGEIVFIDTAETCSDNVDDKLLKAYDGSARFKTSCGNFGGVICATKSTKLIGVSKDKSDFLIKDYSRLENDGNYSIKAYTISEDSLTAAYIIMDIDKDKDFNITNETTPAVIKNIDETLDQDDCAATRLTVLHGGEEKQLLVDQSRDTSKLHIGDVIRYSLDMHDKVVDIKQHFDCKNETVVGKNPSASFSEWFRTVYGTVVKKDGNIIQISTYNSETGEEVKELHTANYFKIYVVDTKGTKPSVSVGSVSDIKSEQEKGGDASRVFIQTRYGDPKVMVVYNK